MALYRFSVQVIRRRKRDGGERSVVAAAAYRAGEKLYCERQDACFSYRNKQGVAHREILAPVGAAKWVFHRERLWNAVERSEKRRNAQLAREVQLALPVELSREAQLRLARAFIGDEFVARGMVADSTLHDDPEKAQPHLHVLLTMRELGRDGFGRKNTSWNSRALLAHWRRSWAHYVNRELARAGRSERVDGSSYAEQGLDFIAEPKRGAVHDHGSDEVRTRSHAQWDEWCRVARENGELILRDPGQALSALTHLRATFTRRDLQRFLNSKTLDAPQFESCLKAVLAHPDLVPLPSEEHGNQRFTTTRVLQREQQVLDTGRELGRRTRHAVGAAAVRAAAKARTLGAEQARALIHITRASGDLALVEGYAGTGKSYLLGAAREAWEAQGYVVIGAALAGKAAEGLQESAGIPSRTLARWELAWSNGRETLTRNHVLVVDEAGMVGSAQMGRVLGLARDAGAKVVLVGDRRQLQAIEAGAPLRVLREELGAATLSEIRRQESPWQRAASLSFAQGEVKAGLAAYAERGHVIEHARHAVALQEVVAAWQRDRTERPYVRDPKDPTKEQRPATSIIISYRRADVRALNEAARALRRASGELGSDHVLRVRDREGVLHDRPFARGDRLYFLANCASLDVKNGTLGTIWSIRATELTVRLDQGRELTFDVRAYNTFDHGYAATAHKAQGVTVDRAYVLASRPFDEAATYVALTRHRAAVELHWAHDEFRPRWAQPSVVPDALPGAVRLHADEAGAIDAAFRQLSAAWRDGKSAVLISPTAAEARELNQQARLLAERDGRLGEASWVRTSSGRRAIALGDRVRAAGPLPELGIAAGTFGTVTARHDDVLELRLDDRRQVSLDTASQRALDHGYAMSLDEAPGLRVEQSIVVATHRLDASDVERLRAPELGVVQVHALSGPRPSQDWLFSSLSRVAENEHALEVQASLAEQRDFRSTVDHREKYLRLPRAEQEKYVARLRELAEQPTLSIHEARLALPEVQDALAVVEKAEAALQDRLTEREKFQQDAGVFERLGERLTERRSAQVSLAEVELRRARTRLEQLLESRDVEERATAITVEHNQRTGHAFDLWVRLSEHAERSEREERLAGRIHALVERDPSQRLRVATETDFGRELSLVRAQMTFGKDLGTVCRDKDGTLVVFDAKRFGSDLAALTPGQSITISAGYDVRCSISQGLGAEMGHDDD